MSNIVAGQSNSDRLQVFIVDDSPILLDRLKERFSEFETVKVIGAAQNVAEASMKLKELKPDVVILDNRMPDGSGMSVLNEIKKDDDSPVVIVYTSFAYPQYRESYLRAGADYFFDKNHDTEVMMQVIENLSREDRLETKHPPADGSGLEVGTEA